MIAQQPPKKISRVCFFNPQGYVMYPPPLGKTDTGGQTLYILQLARALGRKGIKVDIVTRQFDNMPAEEALWENVTIVRIPCGKPTFVQKERLYELVPEMVENFMHYIEKKRKRYDIVHSHYWDGGYGGLLLAKMLDIPHVWTPHSLGKMKKLGMSVEKLPPQKLSPAYRYHVRIAIEQKLLNKANAVVTICETNRIQLLEHYIVDFEKIHMIYPGVDIQYFNTKENKTDADIKLGKDAILTVSRLVPAKGLDLIIEALSLIKNQTDFNLHIAGGTAEEKKSAEELETEKQLKDMIGRYKLTQRVGFIGFVDHDKILPSYYRKADLFILGGRYEPFGLTTLEAMACGTVPIVSSVAGSREVIVDRLNGFIVDTQDKKALSKLILEILTNHKLRKKVAENAAFTIKEHYAWDKIVDKFIKLYKDLL